MLLIPRRRSSPTWKLLFELIRFGADAQRRTSTVLVKAGEFRGNHASEGGADEDQTRKVFRECPCMFVHFSDLKINDVEDLNNYKQLVFNSPALAQEHVGTVKESEDNRVMELNIGPQKDTDTVDDIPNSVSKQENTQMTTASAANEKTNESRKLGTSVLKLEGKEREEATVTDKHVFDFLGNLLQCNIDDTDQVC
ncbi:hypothetical protein J1N35_030272 [Gossypium stocksii]|uniref:Uncharacterized protein n=1 Tax=Gossypium stocksii TaxID=47602 RepID=A0A9D3UZT1_9ROSI|nr:hypothetical protein J1N35_030272 [Gossypium stocksii]